jgi:hypothetical protein
VPGLFSFSVLAEEAVDVDLAIDMSASYHIQDKFLQRDILGFTQNRSYGFVDLHPSLIVGANENINGTLSVDVTWENPQDQGQEDEVDAQVASAYLSFTGSHIRCDIGIQPVVFANGFILSDNVLAAVIHGYQGNGYAELKAARVLDSSPMIGVTLGYRPDYFERLELFGILLSDRDDTLASSFPYTALDAFDLSSDGTLYYLGAAADLFVGDVLLTLVGAYQTGEFTVGFLNNRRTEVNANAYFGDISLEKNLSDSSTVGLFCHLASGDSTPFNRDFASFIYIVPDNPRAAIFFNPEFMDNDYTDRFTFSGGFLGGSVAPGVSLTLLSEWGLSVEAALIYLYAQQALNDGSQWYGWEADLTVNYTFRKKYRLFVEAARFEHGDYFESFLNTQIDPAIRFAAGVHATF